MNKPMMKNSSLSCFFIESRWWWKYGKKDINEWASEGERKQICK